MRWRWRAAGDGRDGAEAAADNVVSTDLYRVRGWHDGDWRLRFCGGEGGRPGLRRGQGAHQRDDLIDLDLRFTRAARVALTRAESCVQRGKPREPDWRAGEAMQGLHWRLQCRLLWATAQPAGSNEDGLLL